jgi:hypothetical protein
VANVYLSLAVGAGDGPAAGTDCSSMGPERTISVDGGAFLGSLVIEASNDGGATWDAVPDVPPFVSATQAPVEINAGYQFMRVSRRGSSGAFVSTPTVKIAGAAPANANVFGVIPAPTGGASIGAPFDLSAGGDVNAIIVAGTFTGQIVVQLSNDGTNFSGGPIFFSRGVQVVSGTFKAARVNVVGLTSGTIPVVSIASGSNTGVGGGGAFPGFGGVPPAIALAGSAGVSGLASQSDHTHAGVTSVAAGAGISISGPANTPTIAATATPFPGFGSAPPAIAPTSSAGTSLLSAQSDHTHEGVHTVNGLLGDVVVNAIQTVATAAALAALPSANFTDGEIAYVQTYKAAFMLIASTQPAAAGVRIAASGKAGYLWVRVVESTAWWSQLTWNVDPSNASGVASDENTGANATGAGTGPLLTFAEHGRRFRGRYLPNGETNSYTINQLSNGVVNDCAQFHLDPFYRGASINITLQGTVTPVAVGTIASAVAKNAATNTGNSITVTGFDFSTHVGQNIRLVGTPTTTAVIEAAPSLGVAQLGEQSVNGTVGAGFTAAQAIEIASLVTLQGVAWSGLGTTLIINDINFGLANPVPLLTSLPVLTAGIRRCQFSTGSANIYTSINATACSFTGGSYNVYGSNSMLCSSFVNTTMFLSGSTTVSGGQNRIHLNACGSYNATLTVDDGNTLRLASDFHCFNLPASAIGILQRYGSQVYSAGQYYGSGNGTGSAGVDHMGGCRWYYANKPVMDAPLGYYYDSNDIVASGPPAGGANVAFASLPFPAAAGGFGQITPKLNAMVAA